MSKKNRHKKKFQSRKSIAAQHDPKTMPAEIALKSTKPTQTDNKTTKVSSKTDSKTRSTLSQDETAKRDRALKRDFQGLMKSIALIALILVTIYYFDQKDGSLTTWSNWFFSKF